MAGALRPHEPWTTAPQAAARYVRLVVLLVCGEFVLNAFDRFMDDVVHVAAWLALALTVAFALVRSERLIGRRGGT
jgi:hypothetical protein